MKKIWKRIKICFGNLSIQTKFIAITISLVFLSAALLTGYFYNVSSGLILDNSRRYIKNTMGQIGENLDYNIEAIERVLFDISTDQDMQEAMAHINHGKLSAYETAEAGVEIKNKLIHFTTKDRFIRGAFLYTLDKKVFATKDGTLENPEEISFEKLEEGKGASVWLDEQNRQEILPVGKVINSLHNQKELGYIVLYIDSSYLENKFQKVSFTTKDDIFLLDSDGKRIVGHTPSEIPKEIRDLTAGNGQVQRMMVGEGYRQICVTPLKQEDWMLVSVSEDEKYNSQLLNLRHITILLLGLLLAGIAALSVLVSRGISSPIRKLVESMERFSKGDFSVYAPAEYKDEIGLLRNSFNRMVSDMEHLVQNIYEEKNLKQQAQIRALQMQINPHFLYNTLDTIQWKAMMHQEEDIAEMTRSLAYLMRFSLREKALVSLEEELDAVENYIRIQCYRYDNLKLDINVEEEVLYENIPCHTVLPLVENAVEHGFSSQKGQKQIVIKGSMEAEKIHLSISDNGRGIPKERLCQILGGTLEKQNEKHMSIGIRNVNERLRLRYGEEYGIKLISEEGKGTCVELTVPSNSL